MKYFSAALLASAVSARGASGGPLQGNPNASVGGQHGYGYNVGNSYLHGDSHGHNFAHQNGYAGTGYDAPKTGDSYTSNNVHEHVYGYDTVKEVAADEWDEASRTAHSLLIIAAVEAAHAARVLEIQAILQRRTERLSDIHEDNILKIEAPFEYQLDMLEEELEDVATALASALTDETDAFTDLKERMTDYELDREEALDREKDKVDRILERAIEEGKAVDEVLYALRLDWLAGVYVAGTTAYFDDDIYDLTIFDTEFDMFTYDVGHGKGHGHRNGVQGPGNDREQGFVTGRGGIGEIDTLKGEPAPKDGKRGRYDRVTQSGEGRRPSMYEIGKRQSNAEGAYGYNQAADLRVDDQLSGPRGMAYKKPAPPKRRPPMKRVTKRRPHKRPSYKKPVRSYRPKQVYQKTRQISKRTAYDDYAPIRRGGYYGRY